MKSECIHCGTVFEFSHTRGPIRKYCSRRCRDRTTGTSYAPRSAIGYADCAECGELFVLRRARYATDSDLGCSDECRRTLKNRRALEWHRHYETKHGHRHVGKRKLAERSCVRCGVSFMGRKNQQHCSRACANQVSQMAATCAARIKNLRPQPSRPLVLYTGPPLRRTVPHVRTMRRLTSGQCRICTQWFVSFHLDVTCSPACFDEHQARQKRLGKDRRRARKRNAYVADVHRKQVYERDGYRCYLCRKKTIPTQTAPHPRAPTIDHVIPLAVGGTHEPSNCRTACFLCNAIKGDRGGGEQLLLIA